MDISRLYWPSLDARLPQVEGYLGAIFAHREAYVGSCEPIWSHRFRQRGRHAKSTKHRNAQQFASTFCKWVGVGPSGFVPSGLGLVGWGWSVMVGATLTPASSYVRPSWGLCCPILALGWPSLELGWPSLELGWRLCCPSLGLRSLILRPMLAHVDPS